MKSSVVKKRVDRKKSIAKINKDRGDQIKKRTKSAINITRRKSRVTSRKCVRSAMKSAAKNSNCKLVKNTTRIRSVNSKQRRPLPSQHKHPVPSQQRHSVQSVNKRAFRTPLKPFVPYKKAATPLRPTPVIAKAKAVTPRVARVRSKTLPANRVRSKVVRVRRPSPNLQYIEIVDDDDASTEPRPITLVNIDSGACNKLKRTPGGQVANQTEPEEDSNSDSDGSSDSESTLSNTSEQVRAIKRNNSLSHYRYKQLTTNQIVTQWLNSCPAQTTRDDAYQHV